jgi:hypothetical protein
MRLVHIASVALLLSISVGASAAVPDENLVGLWRGSVQAEEWVFLFSKDATVRGLIGPSKFGVGQANDSFQYSTQRAGAESRLDLVKVPATGGQGIPVISFTYLLLDATTLELIPIDPSEITIPAGTQRPRVNVILFQRIPLREEIDVQSEVVTFKRTGLMWQISASAQEMSLGDAQAYCQQSRIGGFSNWRLPSKAELSLILDVVHFPTTLAAGESPIFKPLTQPGSGYMFSSTPVPGYNNAPWILNLFNGHIFNGQGYAAYARCVRGV